MKRIEVVVFTNLLILFYWIKSNKSLERCHWTFRMLVSLYFRVRMTKEFYFTLELYSIKIKKELPSEVIIFTNLLFSFEKQLRVGSKSNKSNVVIEFFIQFSKKRQFLSELSKFYCRQKSSLHLR